MSKNLDISTFRNGDEIPEIKTKKDWEKAADNQEPAWCYYKFDETNGKKYGKLYNWYAVNDQRGLAPNGYHVPTDAEWTILIDFLGGDSIAAKQMKSTEGWKSHTKGGNGENSSGFNALPGGLCFLNGNFGYVGENIYLWSSTENDAETIWGRYLYYGNTLVFRHYFNKNSGIYVRCIKD
jgi:uncharacterized protein (TIGR02145 family)